MTRPGGSVLGVRLARNAPVLFVDGGGAQVRPGDRVVVEGMVATVLEMDGHRMARVRVAKGSAGEDEEAAEPEAAGPVAEPTGTPGQGQGEGG